MIQETLFKNDNIQIIEKGDKIKIGMLWYGWNWEKAINEHIKTNDCYILEVYKDISNNLMKNEWVFDCYKLMAYGNRFKEHKTIIPRRFYKQIENLKPNEKFKIVDNFGNKINIEDIKQKGGLKE